MLIVSVASSPSCTFPPTVISPSAVTLPVTSKLPVILVFAWISTIPVPFGIKSRLEFDTVVEITLVSNLKSSSSNVFNETTLSVPTVVRFNTVETVSIVLPEILTSPINAVPVVTKSVDLVVPLMSNSY